MQQYVISLITPKLLLIKGRGICFFYGKEGLILADDFFPGADLANRLNVTIQQLH